MRGVKAPIILTCFLVGVVYLLYTQQEDWVPTGTFHVHLGKTQVFVGPELPPETKNETVHIQPVQERRLPGFCDYCGPEDLYCQKYGHFNLARSRAYEGPNVRLKRVLRKAQSGQKIKIGVLGGSVTKGHGVTKDENWTTQYKNWWQSMFTNTEVEITNGAVGGTISTYLETCFGEHMDDDVDLVVIEMAINDQRLDGLVKSYENLIRAIFDLPKSPAIIHLQITALSFTEIAMGGDVHLAAAQYYDTPVISVRNVVLPHILSTTERSLEDTSVEDYWFHHNRGGDIDLRHMNLNGHRICADMLSAFTQKMYCEVLRENQLVEDGKGHGMWGWQSKEGDFLPDGQDGEYVPRIRLFQAYDHTTILLPSHPTCQAVEAKRHPINPVSSSGWAIWSHESRRDKLFYRATKPGDNVTFKLTTSSVGRIRITYQRSRDYGFGSLSCWIDDQREKAVRLDGWWNVANRHTASTTDITNSASPGDHLLHCEILKDTKDPKGGTEFRIIAVDAL